MGWIILDSDLIIKKGASPYDYGSPSYLMG